MRSSIASRALLGLVGIAWLVGTGCLIWLMIVVPNRAQTAVYRDVSVEIGASVTPERLARKLHELGVVAEPRAYAFYLRTLGVERRLREGFIVVNRGLTPRQHLSRVALGYPRSYVEVTIPEGFTSFDIATRLERFGVVERASLLSAVRDATLLGELGIEGPSAEGYLFPALYRFDQETPPAAVVRRMVQTFRARTDPLMQARLRLPTRSSPLTAHEVVILASIVEREARVPEERPTIAGVFVNRLLDPAFRPKRLQADPTVAYGCLVAGERAPSCREFDGRRITPAMVRDPENPYSTYRHEGLPPGPICNPGLASLQAALVPDEHGYLYFVASGGGRHTFSATLEQHNRAVHPGAAPP